MKIEKKQLLLCTVSVMVALSMSIGALGWVFESVLDVSAAEGNATLSGYEAQIKDLEAQEAALKNKINELKKDSANAMKLKLTLDEKLNLTYGRIDAAKALIEELTGQIEANEANIAVMQENLDKQQQIFKERLRLAHEDRNVSYITMLFDADGLAEFFNNIERVGALLDYDKKVMDKYIEQKMTLEDTRAQLNEQVNKQKKYQEELSATEKELEDQIKEVDAMLVQINANQSSVQTDLDKIKAEEKKLEAELAAYLKKLQEQENKAYMVKGQLQWPVKTNSTGYNRITSTFGYRDLTVGGNDVSNHKGIDIGVRYVNIYSCGEGKVVTSTYSSSYGYYIVVDHGGGVSTLYAHLSKLGVKKGDEVTAGQYIGVSGNTGWSSGPHLHLEIRISGNYKNPLTIKDNKGQYYLSRPSNLVYIN